VAIYDVGFSVEGLGAIYRNLTAKGFGFVSPPVTYNPYGKNVRQAILLGPTTRTPRLIRVHPGNRMWPAGALPAHVRRGPAQREHG